jgi:predicted nucleic-acid-binding Zn-ribbon protein
MSIFKSKPFVISIIVFSCIAAGALLYRDISSKPLDISTEAERYSGIQQRIVDTNCPKCGGKFENGFLIDRTRGSVHISNCVQGNPKVDTSGVNDEPSSPVVTMRCKSCGFLESYAN